VLEGNKKFDEYMKTFKPADIDSDSN